MRSKMPPEYRVPDDPDTNKMDAAYLRTCLGIRTLPGEEPPPLPLAVRRAHYDLARALSLLGGMGPTGMDRTQLAFVVVLALRDPDMEMPQRKEQVAPTPAPSAPKPKKNLTIASGDEVIVTVDGTEVAGNFRARGPGGRLAVIVDGTERFFRPDDVRLPEKALEEVETSNQPVEV